MMTNMVHHLVGDRMPAISTPQYLWVWREHCCCELCFPFVKRKALHFPWTQCIKTKLSACFSRSSPPSLPSTAGSFVAPLMAEHRHFISSFSRSLQTHPCGPRWTLFVRPHLLAPKHPGIPQEHVHLHIYISSSQFPFKKRQWQLSEAVSLHIFGTPEGSFNDGSIPYS